jgi:hypothetical protein
LKHCGLLLHSCYLKHHVHQSQTSGARETLEANNEKVKNETFRIDFTLGLRLRNISTLNPNYQNLIYAL